MNSTEKNGDNNTARSNGLHSTQRRTDPLVARLTSVSILGSEVQLPTIHEVVDIFEHWIEQRDGRCRQVLVTGFHGLQVAKRDPTYFQIGQECDLWVPDSIAPVLIARKRGIRQAVRTPGADIMTAFFHRANEKCFRSYFYGDTEATLAALQAKLIEKYPHHRVVGMYSPAFRRLSTTEEQEHIDAINAANPDVLWVGLGLPKQDAWIHRFKNRLNVPVAVGVGAAFGFLSGTTPRAPKGLQRAGLEWAYMLARRPKRTARRVLVDGSQFAWNVFREELSGIVHRRHSNNK